jgi:hypothetical protein
MLSSGRTTKFFYEKDEFEQKLTKTTKGYGFRFAEFALH